MKVMVKEYGGYYVGEVRGKDIHEIESKLGIQALKDLTSATAFHRYWEGYLGPVSTSKMAPAEDNKWVRKIKALRRRLGLRANTFVNVYIP